MRSGRAERIAHCVGGWAIATPQRWAVWPCGSPDSSQRMVELLVVKLLTCPFGGVWASTIDVSSGP